MEFSFNFTVMILGWSPFKVVQRFPFRAKFWLPLQPKGEKKYKNYICKKLLAILENDMVQMVLRWPSTLFAKTSFLC